MELLFSESLLRALCWTFLHSLWMGLAAAVLSALVIGTTRRSPAVVRYNLLSGILFSFLLANALLFIVLIQNGTTAEENSVPVKGNDLAYLLVTDKELPAEISGPAPFTERFSGYFNEHAPFVMLVWFLIFFARALHLAAGLRYVHRLRAVKNSAVEGFWQTRLSELSGLLAVKQPRFLESALIKMPVVIGILRPAILVPVGWLAQLPADQVEAVLLHELAHVRRRDFLINLLESAAEAVFFFNPAVIWITSLIREEREACCDDVVMAHLPEKKAYVEALISFQELSLKQEGYALALTGRRNHLLHRVRRMLTRESKNLSIMEKTFLVAGMAVLSAFGVWTSQPVKAQQPTAPVQQKMAAMPAPVQAPVSVATPVAPQPFVPDTLPKQKTAPKAQRQKTFTNITTRSTADEGRREVEIDATDSSGKKYHVRQLNGETREFSINGVEVPKEDYETHRDVLSGLGERRVLTERKMAMENRMLEHERRMTEVRQKRNALMKERVEKQKELKREKLDKNKEQLKREKLMLKSGKPGGERMEEERRMRMERMRSNDSARRIYVNKNRAYRVNLSSNSEINGLIRDLQGENLITDTEDLSFSLTNRELVVNGKKQSTELHQRFREKYIHKPGDHFRYSHKGGSTSITINKDE